MEQEYLSVHQVAEVFGVVDNTVRNWVKSGLIKSVRLGTMIRIPREELTRIATEKHGPQSQVGVQVQPDSPNEAADHMDDFKKAIEDREDAK